VSAGQPAPVATDYVLDVVNSVWGQKTYTWEAPFLDVLARSYGAGVYLQDFAGAPDPSRQAINSWVSSATAGKIENLLPAGSIDMLTRMVLVNAIHLKMPWATPFDATQTTPGPFARQDGTTVMASFMTENTELAYEDDGNAQIVGVPLSGGNLEVVFALPHGDLASYESTLTSTSAALAGPSGSAMVHLSLPKVTFTSPTFSLSDALKGMGMVQAFDQGTADLTGMCANPPDGEHLYVTDVLQKATLAMEENGVEAAAATAVLVSASLSAVTNFATMNLDQPFVVSILDTGTGAVLFLGHVVDPTDPGSP
jgi:serpin B